MGPIWPLERARLAHIGPARLAHFLALVDFVVKRCYIYIMTKDSTRVEGLTGQRWNTYADPTRRVERKFKTGLKKRSEEPTSELPFSSNAQDTHIPTKEEIEAARSENDQTQTYCKDGVKKGAGFKRPVIGVA